MKRTILILLCLIFFAVTVSAQTPKAKGHASKKSPAAKKAIAPKPRPATIMLKKEGTGITGDITSISLGNLSLLIEGRIYTYRLDDVASISFESPENAEQTSSRQPNQSDVAEQSSTTPADAESAEADKASPPETPASSKPTTKAKGGMLSIEAAIVYSYGGVQPVARTEFMLFVENPDVLLAEISKPDENGRQLNTTNLFGSVGGNIYVNGRGDEGQVAYKHLIQKRVQSVTTDFTGKATFKPVIPGQYYIFGVTATRGGVAVWNIPIQIEIGENSLTVDQNNAVSIR